MGFAQDVTEVRQKIEPFMEAIKKITPEVMDKIEKAAALNLEDIEEVSAAATVLSAYGSEIQVVNDGMDSIKKVIKAQNHIENVSNIRDSIGLIAGSIDEVKKAADYANVFGAVVAMKPMVEEALKLSIKMDLVLDLEEKMDSMVEAEAKLNSKFKEMRMMEEKTSRVSTLVADILNRVNVKEHRINESLSRMEEIFKSMNEFHVKVSHVGSSELADAAYDRTNNRLDLNIPMGKTGPRGNHKGDKGNPGKNGSNFTPSYMGNIFDRGRFNGHALGTSFLSLDEIPTMIYFRKSNTTGDWTDGQPFGVSNGGYSDEDKGVDIVNGINIDELTKHILRNMKRREDGSTNGS